jgi:hypothetical protein
MPMPNKKIMDTGWKVGFILAACGCVVYYLFQACWGETEITKPHWWGNETAAVTRFHFGYFIERLLWPSVAVALAGGVGGSVVGHVLGLGRTGSPEDADLTTDDVKRLKWVLCLQGLSIGLFLPGLFVPCITMTPHVQPSPGRMDWIRLLTGIFGGDPKPQDISIVSGIRHLLSSGDLLIGLIILLFSVVFPAVKNGIVSYTAYQKLVSSEFRRNGEGTAFHVMSQLGKWSMLDVMVLALCVVAFKTFPLGSTIELRYGTYLFAGSVILSMVSTSLLKGHQDARC